MGQGHYLLNAPRTRVSQNVTILPFVSWQVHSFGEWGWYAHEGKCTHVSSWLGNTSFYCLTLYLYVWATDLNLLWYKWQYWLTRVNLFSAYTPTCEAQIGRQCHISMADHFFMTCPFTKPSGSRTTSRLKCQSLTSDTCLWIWRILDYTWLSNFRWRFIVNYREATTVDV